jgi:hypothetical protein
MNNLKACPFVCDPDKGKSLNPERMLHHFRRHHQPLKLHYRCPVPGCEETALGEFSERLKTHMINEGHFAPLHTWIVDSLDANLLYMGETYKFDHSIDSYLLADPAAMQKISVMTDRIDQKSALTKHLTATAYMIEQGFLASLGHATSNYQEFLMKNEDQHTRFRRAYMTSHPPCQGSDKDLDSSTALHQKEETTSICTWQRGTPWQNIIRISPACLTCSRMI